MPEAPPSSAGRGLLPLAGLLVLAGTAAAQADPSASRGPPALAAYEVSGDGIPHALTASPGDAQRGRAIVASRQTGLCLLCHSAPIDEERFQGTLAPSLAGAGRRWSAAQLRLRLVDPSLVTPGTMMPAYHRIDGLERVGAAWQGRPVLEAQQIEDVVAYLVTLR